MKKLLFVLTAAFAAMSMLAAPVDQAAAMRKAQSYLQNELYAGKFMAPAALNPVLVMTETGDTKSKEPVYYIYNTSTTYLVIAGDDRAEDILMVGETPLDVNNIPPGMMDMLNYYKEQIEFLFNHPNLEVKKREPNTSLRAVTYGPLLQSKWDQSAPYWKYCKFTYSGSSYQCYTGCPATSAAQVMYYWKYPEGVDAMASYSANLELSQNNIVSNYNYPALDATTFNWASMKNYYGTYYDDNGNSHYSTYTTAQGDAVATLMRYIGQAEKMMYGTASAGGSGIYTTATSIIATMFKNWGYKSTARYVEKSGAYGTNNAWSNLLIGEMAASRPIVFSAVSSAAGGHAFNVDGYRDSDSKFHVNFGWSGLADGWMAINAFTDNDGYTFNLNQQAIIGIEAPNGIVQTPELTVSTNSLTFTGNVGQSITQTFTVNAANLVDDVTLSSTSSIFTVSPSTLTKAQAQAGATITVTYTPASAGTTTATLNVASLGVETQSISLKGTATSVPTITVNPESLSFETAVGSQEEKTFYLKGISLTKVVYLSVSGTGFSISRTNVTASGANNGLDITVTYKPTTSGTHTGTVTLTSIGAETVTLPLSGTAIGTPTITASPTSLSFSTTPGQAVTKTFTVNGSDLTGNVALSVNGTGFSINKTNISQSDALNGTTVTVTYNPTAGGNHTGTVTLTSPGASSVTVNLTGTSVVTPTLTVNPNSLSLNTVVGTPVTKTFTVNGANLTNAVTLSVSGVGFSIDKTNITPSGANNGATVTVTYNPTAAGTHTGTVTLTSTGAQTVTVALNGSATEPPRTITVNPSVLNMTAATGEEVTATFNVSGQNLTGNLTLTLTDANGVYDITPMTISAAAANAGNVPVTVYYAPGVAGTQNATITISGGGASAVSVALNGTAYLAKYAPVMLPAVEEYINLTKFRADWTDETPEINVASYTLEVNAKAVEPQEPVLLHSLSGSAYPGNNYNDITLPAPWAGVNVRGGNNAIYIKNNYNNVAQGYITYTIPEGYTNATFTLVVSSINNNNGVGDLTVSTPQTAAVSHDFVKNETFYWVVTASSGEKITMISTDPSYSPDMSLIAVYSGDATPATLRANETGDEYTRTITGITDKFYTVENLVAEGTFLYKVKAIYIDGTESEWSNEQEVTLFANGHGYELGDVNHDGKVNITDVTTLISYVANGSGNICMICADYNEDGYVNITDVISLISRISNTKLNLPHQVEPQTGK